MFYPQALKFSIFSLVLLAFFWVSCGVIQTVEQPIKTINPKTEKLLGDKSAITWSEAEGDIRCHFIYSASCVAIEKEKNIKFYSHLNRCTEKEDIHFTTSDGHLYLLKNVSFRQANIANNPDEIELEKGLLFKGVFNITAKKHRVYDVATKKLDADSNSGLPANTFSVWYQENPITEEGRWICDLCKYKPKFEFIDCDKGNELLEFMGYKSPEK
jgi:hypothetical protein